VGLWCIEPYGYKKKPYRLRHHRSDTRNSDVHSSEDEDIPAQCDSDTGDTTDTHFAQWPDNTNVSTYS